MARSTYLTRHPILPCLTAGRTTNIQRLTGTQEPCSRVGVAREIPAGRKASDGVHICVPQQGPIGLPKTNVAAFSRLEFASLLRRLSHSAVTLASRSGSGNYVPCTAFFPLIMLVYVFWSFGW
jgi:hypothetical protein